MASIEKRIVEDGSTSYRVKIRMKGRPPESATFDRLTDAREWSKKIEADMKANRHFGVSKRHTVAELLDRYEAAELPKLKSADTVKASPTSTVRRSVLWNINNLVCRVATTFRYCVADGVAPAG